MREAKALASLRAAKAQESLGICANSPEISLVVYAISTNISCTGLQNVGSQNKNLETSLMKSFRE